MMFFNDFSALYYISYIVLSSFTLICCDANRVGTMHDLLSCSGWLEMTKVKHRINILDWRRPDRGEKQWCVFDLKEPPVTEENVTDKIYKAHHFLSCWYAKTLINLCDYEQGIGPQCRRRETAKESFDCLEDYAQVILYKRHVVLRMTGALSSLQELAPFQTQFEKKVFDILVELEEYHQRDAVIRPPDEDGRTTKRIADAESKAIEEHSRLTMHRLLGFFNKYCYPITYWIRESGLSKPAEDIVWLAKWSCNKSVTIVRMIKGRILGIVKEFTEWYDTTSGFDYDPESNTTRITRYDPEIDRRVEKLDLLLRNKVPFQDLSERLEIKERGNPNWIVVEELFRPAEMWSDTVVTKENLHSKLRKSHQFISCLNAWHIVDICHYVTDMWSSCMTTKDYMTPNRSACAEIFLRILKEVDPLLLRMIDSLMYFYQLSPDTSYNKYVFDLLKRFKTFFDEITARTDRDVTSLSPDIERGISENLQNSTEFFQQFCYTGKNIHSNDFLVCWIYVKGAFFIERMLQLSRYYDVFN